MADPYRIRTPSGRVETIFGNPPGRQAGPTQNWIPVGPPPSYNGVPISLMTTPVVMSQRGAVEPMAADITPATDPQLQDTSLASIPKLTSPIINLASGTLAVPWTQFFVNLFRLAQPTGIKPGTYAGITFNVFGQALNANNSGATIDSPNLTGSPTTTTPPANDNSTRIANTQWVQEQHYISNLTIAGDVSGSGGSTTTVTVVGLRGRPIAPIQPAPNQVLGFVGGLWTPINVIPEAPQDDQIYGRQNGQWVVIPTTPPPPG